MPSTSSHIAWFRWEPLPIIWPAMARNGWQARQANGGAIASGWPLVNDGGQRLAGGGPPWHHTGWPTMAGVRVAGDLMAGHN